ncbi:MAG: ATP-dependent helicase HrpB [Rhodothermales bacterium]
MSPRTPRFPELPIDSALPGLLASLGDEASCVLQAPPGAGKTTHVPLALLDAPWLAGQRIVLLEPRRLAARAAAYRMADLLGEDAGRTVGYRMRQETRVSRHTRIEVVTEGVLTRMLLDDPSLEGIGIVIFDEFHERSLPADAGLAFCRQTQDVLRPDLRLLVMSATLDADALAQHLGEVPVVRSEGRMHPVETHYLGHALRGLRPENPTAEAVRRALRETEGDILVFLPGTAEIRRTLDLLTDAGAAVDVLPLFGDLTREEQDRALKPAASGRRKVILATSIAETSLTIDGVRVVVDAGLMRVPRFDASSGMTRLATLPVARDAADQRRGRAGRQAPGVCYRLWSDHEQQHLADARPPEILDADLAPLALDLAAWGAADPSELAWIDPPPAAAFARARKLLADLDALDAAGRLTPLGRDMADLPTHPRLAHMLLRSPDKPLAADLAALLEERDLLRGADGIAATDLRLRVELLNRVRAGERPGPMWHHMKVDRGALHQVLHGAARWRKRLGAGDRPADPSHAGAVLALAYPDRIAQRLAEGRYRMRDGRRAILDPHDPLASAPFLAAASLDGRPEGARLFLAAPLYREEIEAVLGGQVDTVDAVVWDRTGDRVVAKRERRLGAVVLAETPLNDAAPEAIARALLGEVAARGLHLLDWSKEAERLRARMAFVHHHFPDWPDASTEHLTATLADWLAPFVQHIHRLDELKKIDLVPALTALLGWERQRQLDTLAPERLEVPSGSAIAVDYSDPAKPVLAVRLQEVFGMMETPRLAGGRVPVTMHLLSPAQRPVQVTQDLASFWRDTYFDVRKDLRGRYPKHYWPEDPSQAEPTRRVKPR